MNELQPFFNEPKLPLKWDYDESVKKVKSLIYKWKNLTEELFNELELARKVLSVDPKKRERTASGTFVPVGKNWNTYCQDIGHTPRVVNRWLRNWIELKKRANSPALPKFLFTVIYADPPWEYDFSETRARAIESKYPTMTIDSICNKKIPSDKDAVLFLWATAPKLPEAMSVLEAWGFKYVTNSVWDKEIIGMGYWFRGQHEMLLVGVRGEVHPAEAGLRNPSVYREKRTKHSRKPDKYYEYIEKMFPDCKKIELFQTKQREGWIGWGIENESR